MAIRNDASTTDTDIPMIDNNDDDGTEGFLKTMLTDADDDDQPSGSEEDKRKRPANDEDDDEASDESPEDKDADDDEGDKDEDDDGKDDTVDKKRKYADDADETYVKIKVNGKDEEVTVASLKRLYGQEKALTQKSQEVADHRKHVDGELEKQTAAAAAIFDRANARWEPYSQIDFNLAAKELPADEYTALRAAAQSAWEDVQFLGTQVDAFHGTIRERQQTDLVARAKKGIEVLTSDPEKGGIEGFDEKLYNDIRSYALQEGCPQDVAHNLVEPWVIKLFHKARLYDRGRAKTADKTIVTKVNKTPKKVVKTSQAPDRTSTSNRDTASITKATAKLRMTGSLDDAADAFMARMAKDAAE